LADIEKIKAALRPFFPLAPGAAVKSNPIGPLTVGLPFGGLTQPHPFDFHSHLKVYLVNVHAFAAQRAIARDVAAVPLLVQERKTVDGKLTWETIEDGSTTRERDLWDIVNHPNNTETSGQLIERMVLSLLGTGNGYWIFDDDDKEFHHVNPCWVHVKCDANGNLEEYKIENKGKKFNADIDSLIHWKLANADGEFYGVPPSTVIKKTIMTKLALNQYLQNFFYKNALPGMSFTTDQDITPEQRDETRKEINRLYSGPENSHGAIVLSNGQKLDRLSHNMKDLIPGEIETLVKREVLAAYGVPPAKLGDLDGASYANANIQEKFYYEGTICPIGRMFADVFNMQFVIPQYGKQLRVKWAEDTIQALQPDENEKGKRLVGYVNGGIMTPNEARGKIGLGAIDGGDELRRTSSIESLLGQSGDDKGAETPSPRRIIRVVQGKSEDDPRSQIRELHKVKITTLERKFVVILNAFFDGQLDRVLTALDKMAVHGRINPALLYAVSTKDDAEDDAGKLINIEAENAALTASTGTFVREAVHKAGEDAIAEIGADLAFNVDNPEVAAMIETFHNRMHNVNDSVYGDIKKILRRGYDEGQGISEIEKAIRDKYQEFPKFRSTRIATTEMNGMVNGGADEAYRMGGVTKKMWISAFLDTSRPEHTAADGQIVPITSRFQVGGELLKYPGDPGGSAYNVVNCYCKEIPVVD